MQCMAQTVKKSARKSAKKSAKKSARKSAKKPNNSLQELNLRPCEHQCRRIPLRYDGPLLTLCLWAA